MADSVWYATREDVKAALDYKETARNNGQVDRAVEAASRAVEGYLHRRFYPYTGTRYFDYPNDNSRSPSWRLWLGQNEAISITSLTSGGTSVSSQDYNLEPGDYGPPFDRVEINRSSSASFRAGDTPQRSIGITGVFGYDDTSTAVGTLSGLINDSVTTLTLSNGASIGVGSILKIESERLLVTERQWVDSGEVIETALNGQNNNVSLDVFDESLFTIGETVLIDSEKMLIVDITENTLLVKRAWDGSTLATHADNAEIHVSRVFTVTRGALGTTAASHNNGVSVRVQVIPGLIRELTIAEAINFLLQESSGYARISGSGENSQEYTGRGLNEIRKLARARYGRQIRARAV